MSDDKVNVAFGATTGDLENGAAIAAKAVGGAVDQMKGTVANLGSAVEELKSKFLGFGALLLGGLGFKEVIDEAKKFNLETEKMSMLLGVNHREASALGTALEMIGSSSEAYTGVLQRLTMRLRQGEDNFNQMGIATRDANGSLLNQQEILQSALAALMKYKEGTDRNLASTYILGRSWAEASKLLRLSKIDMEEIKETQEKLNLVVGPESLAASRQYQIAMVKAEEVAKAYAVTIGNTVIPVMTHMLNLFADSAPTQVGIFRKAIIGLTGAFNMVIMAIELVWDRFKEWAESMLEVWNELVAGVDIILDKHRWHVLDFFWAFGKAIIASIKGNREEVTAIWKEYDGKQAALQEASAAKEAAQLKKNLDAQLRIRSEHANARFAIEYNFEMRLKALFAKPSDRIPTGGSKEFVAPESTEDKEKGFMKQFQEQLSDRKLVYALMNDMRKMSADQEADFWETVLRLVDKKGELFSTITKKIADLRLKQMEKEHKDELGLLAEGIKLKENLAESAIKQEEQDAQQQFDMGKITKQQLIVLQQTYEAERLALQLAAQQERITLAERDPDNPVKIKQDKDKLLELEATYLLKRNKMRDEAAKEEDKYRLANESSFQSNLSSGISTLLTKWQTLATSLKSIFLSIYQSLIKNLVADPLAELAMMFIKKTAMYAAFQTWYSGMLVTAGITEVVAKKGAAAAIIPSEAAIAAGGAAESQAAIPIVGPELAAIAYAETYAMVMAGLATSAGGDWRIPKDRMNIVHAQETILPADKSKGLDELISKGSSATINIHARSDADVVRVGDMKKLFTQMQRNFAMVRPT